MGRWSRWEGLPSWSGPRCTGGAGRSPSRNAGSRPSGAGDGQLLLLTGEAGIGKTRFLQALQDLATDQGFAVWSAAAFPQDVELSAGLLLDLGHSMSRSDDPDVAGLGRALVDDLSALPAPSAGSGDAHRQRRLLVLDAVARLAALADDGPVLLALEDLHWCDELSLDVITHLARRLRSRPMLVVGTLRTDELHPDLPVRAWRSRLLLQRMAEEVPLPRLTRTETARMVAELLPQRRRVLRASSSWSSSGPAGCRCTSRSWSRPWCRATCPPIRRTSRRRWPRRSTSGSACSPRRRATSPSRRPSSAAASTST